MNDHGLTKENLLATLPQALRQDPSVAALADAIADVLARRPAEIDRLRIYPAIDQLDAPLLDILAKDFKVDWWDPNYSLEEKRRTLRDNWRVHKSLGTPAAVVTAISAIYQGTTLEEWFQYGGEPYHFRLNIDVTGDKADPERMQRVLDRLEYYKSLRSHLDSVYYSARVGPLPFDTEETFLLLLLAIPLRFRSYGGGFIVLDGRRRLDGTWKLGQDASGVRMIHSAYRAILSESNACYITVWGMRNAVHLPHRVEVPLTGMVFHGEGIPNPQRVRHQSTEIHGTFRTKEAFHGTLTHDPAVRFDGSYSWDGSRKFNAGSKEEL